MEIGSKKLGFPRIESGIDLNRIQEKFGGSNSKIEGSKNRDFAVFLKFLFPSSGFVTIRMCAPSVIHLSGGTGHVGGERLIGWH